MQFTCAREGDCKLGLGGDNDLEKSYKYVLREVDSNQTLQQPLMRAVGMKVT